MQYLEKINRIIKILNLTPLEKEGGYFRRTFSSSFNIPHDQLPSEFNGSRISLSTIYYLITKDSFSSLHKVCSDEIFHFYFGDPVEMLLLYPKGEGERIKIGNKLEEGFIPQVVVPRNTWQGCKLISEGEFALFGVTVSPGFEYDDFVSPIVNDLIRQYPPFAEQIVSLSKDY